jgi:hypothetical protein
MGIINVNKLVDMIDDKNHYTYMRVKNLLKGFRGKATKKEIQNLRKIIQRELTTADKVLEKLENE